MLKIGSAVCHSLRSTRHFIGVMAEIIKLEKLNGKGLPEDIIQKAINALRSGGVIAVPTDTIYGVAVLAQNTKAMKRIYELKGRSCKKPIAICVADVQDVKRWSTSTICEDVLHDLLPGPVTVVLQRSLNLNPELNSFTDLVGIRVPNHSFIRSLARAAGEPLALTSANISSAKSTLCIKEFESLWPELDLIIDGGILGDSEESRAGSTVVDLSQEGSYSIIRPGSAEIKTEDILRQKYGFAKR